MGSKCYVDPMKPAAPVRRTFTTVRPQKLLNVSRLQALRWKPRIGLEDGIRMTYDWYLEHDAAGASRR